MSPEERKNFKKICIMPGERNTSRPRPIPTFASFKIKNCCFFIIDQRFQQSSAKFVFLATTSTWPTTVGHRP